MLLLVVCTNAVDWLERLVSKMMYGVSSGTFNHAHSFSPLIWFQTLWGCCRQRSIPCNCVEGSCCQVSNCLDMLCSCNGCLCPENLFYGPWIHVNLREPPPETYSSHRALGITVTASVVPILCNRFPPLVVCRKVILHSMLRYCWLWIWKSIEHVDIRVVQKIKS